MLNIANLLRRFGPSGRKATELYGSIVAQSRQPAFYMNGGVPDTVNGRYEMVVLHLAVVLEALSSHEGSDGPLGRSLTERFITDMDDSMREMAIGDMSVPRKVKKVAAGLRERALAYRAAANDGKEQLSAVIAGFFEVEPTGRLASVLADYHLEMRELMSEPAVANGLREGRVSFPTPPAVGETPVSSPDAR